MGAAIKILGMDTVATAVELLEPGESVRVTGVEHGAGLVARETISAGHKIALQDIARGEHIVKYGEVIGAATEDIAVGRWVHVHNCRGVKARRLE